jgi:predicted amidohydrolase
VLVCYDNNIVENVRIAALRGAELLIAPTRPAAAAPRTRT